MADKRFVSDKPLIFDSDLDIGLDPNCDFDNLNFVRDTPSYFGLPFCEF